MKLTRHRHRGQASRWIVLIVILGLLAALLALRIVQHNRQAVRDQATTRPD